MIAEYNLLREQLVMTLREIVQIRLNDEEERISDEE